MPTVSWMPVSIATFSLVPTPSVRGDQHRVGEPRRLQVEQRAEAAEPAHHAGPVRRARQRLDRLDQRVARLDVHPGRAVGQAVAGAAGS